MTAGRTYSVTMNRKSAANQHIDFFVASIYYTGMTEMTVYNAGFCRYFTY